MKIIRSIDSISSEFAKGSSLTLGNFDGIHLGHQTLLYRTVEIARELSIPSVVVTYHPNPAVVLGKKPNFKYLSLEEEKEELIRQFAIDYLVVLEFTESLSKMSAEDFLENIIIQKLNAKHIVIGYNHFFGSNRRGDYSLLNENKVKYGYEVELKEAVLQNNSKISSSLIRGYLERGDMAEAKSLLGRNYHLRGKVIHGLKRGRTIGYPTANLEIHPSRLLPSFGVYACFVYIEGRCYSGMMNIGLNPTFGGEKINIEVNIFDFESDIYNQTIDVELVGKVRDEKKFNGIDELKKQLSEDKKESLDILNFNHVI